MPQEYKAVIADTSALILLNKVDKLGLLQKVFHTITTTSDIAAEFRQKLPSWVEVVQTSNKEYRQLLQLEIDNGQASAFALAIETGNTLLVVDDIKGRKLAAKLELAYTGTLGVLLNAKQSGIIPNIKPVLDKIQLTNFKIAERLYWEMLLWANEGA